jgi:glycosyltransferase involved in cell wall biosynthesis
VSGPATQDPGLGGLRIAVVNWRDPWHPEAGGAERYAWEIGRGLVARGAAVHYLTARAPGQGRRGRHDAIGVTRLGGRFTVYPLVLGWLLAHRRSFDAVIDCQNGIPFFTPWVLPRRVPVLCLVHHVHTAQFGVHFPRWMAWAGRLLEGPVARRAYRRHACVAISPSTVTAMRERLRWTGDIYLVPPGAPAPGALASGTPAPGALAPGTPAPGARASGTPAHAALPPGAPAPGAAAAEPGTLSWVGRLVVHKRAELILPVARRLDGTGLAIDVVGRGPAAAGLADAVAAGGLSGVVRLHGFLPEADKQAIVARSLLHLNTSQGEGWGLCVLEAAALGVPTVAYDVDGLRDAVWEGRTGWLVRAGEAIEDVSERAVKELADPARRAAVAAACRRWAGALDWDRSAARFAALISHSVRYGTSRGRRPGAWIVSGPAGAVPAGELAEGPVLDALLDAHPGLELRAATPLERLLGRAAGEAGDLP